MSRIGGSSGSTAPVVVGEKEQDKEVEEKRALEKKQKKISGKQKKQKELIFQKDIFKKMPLVDAPATQKKRKLDPVTQSDIDPQAINLLTGPQIPMPAPEAEYQHEPDENPKVAPLPMPPPRTMTLSPEQRATMIQQMTQSRTRIGGVRTETPEKPIKTKEKERTVRTDLDTIEDIETDFEQELKEIPKVGPLKR